MGAVGGPHIRVLKTGYVLECVAGDLGVAQHDSFPSSLHDPKPRSDIELVVDYAPKM
jgi:hypothetical protein